VNGTIEVSGISAPVEIARDPAGIPHIFGATRLDALYGLGYAHAQDRLWQMEFQRRIGFGRLSEIFGAATIAQDRFLRTVGFRTCRAVGVGAPAGRLAGRHRGVLCRRERVPGDSSRRALPPEFSVLSSEPEPWTDPT
jgi:penicillin amidase